MCKDKWNSFNSNYKKILNYHKGIRNHTCFWDLVSKEKERHHLPCQFNLKIYDQIELFQGKSSVTIPLHSKDINIDGDEIC
jgi:superoxide dismutase